MVMEEEVGMWLTGNSLSHMHKALGPVSSTANDQSKQNPKPNPYLECSTLLSTIR
jgi:hypothetical protein